MAPDLNDDYPDPQDQSEVFDEDNYTLDDTGGPGADMKTLEELPNVMDVTSAVGDADDDAALIGEELDDDEIIDLETDADMADFEDDEIAARMPESLRLNGATTDVGDPRAAAADKDDVELIYSGDMEDVSEDDARTSSLESDTLDDDDIEDLGYPGDGAPEGGKAADDRLAEGGPGEPTRFEIAVRDHLWVLTRDGQEIHRFGHAERAIHEAAELARELRQTGQPALVYLQPAEGSVIEITDDDPPAEPAEDEESAVVPDRSTDG